VVSKLFDWKATVKKEKVDFLSKRKTVFSGKTGFLGHPVIKLDLNSYMSRAFSQACDLILTRNYCSFPSINLS
jgi:hypothetical protein